MVVTAKISLSDFLKAKDVDFNLGGGFKNSIQVINSITTTLSQFKELKTDYSINVNWEQKQVIVTMGTSWNSPVFGTATFTFEHD